VVQRLSAAVAKALASPDLSAKLEDMGIERVGSTPEQARAFLDAEIEKWSKVIRSSGIKVE
jgi:tripartite-type tricarboxylate transporter receptor subunit TctC